MATSSLSQKIVSELGKREPSEIIELCLDCSTATEIEGLTDEYVNLEVLSLAGVGLKSLNGMPNLPSLRSLDLPNNEVSDGLEVLTNCPNLEQLNLSNNRIEKVEYLTPLSKLSSLRSLDVVNCPITLVENYRKKIFALLPGVKYVDGLDENDEEEPATDELTNGDFQETGDGVEDDVGDDEDEESDEDDEEIGIEALQRSGELEDDEEDYAPGEEEEAELDDYDDVDDEDEDDVEEDNGANLSGAGVTGPRRAALKRRHEEEQDAENGDADGAHCANKHKAADGVGEHVKNGSSLDG